MSIELGQTTVQERYRRRTITIATTPIIHPNRGGIYIQTRRLELPRNFFQRWKIHPTPIIITLIDNGQQKCKNGLMLDTVIIESRSMRNATIKGINRILQKRIQNRKS
jgi:hypothetical protein